jgi:hypothetical protein
MVRFFKADIPIISYEQPGGNLSQINNKNALLVTAGAVAPLP